MAGSTPSFVDYLPRAAIDWISVHADKRGVPASGVLVSEGANAGDIYFVAAGTFEVKVADQRGGQQKISQLGRGAVIGEMSWLDGGPASATIEALEASEVLAINGAALDAKIAADPVFGSAFYRALAQEAFVRLRAGNALLSKV
jgi:CRP-like cAMP-binding protein